MIFSSTKCQITPFMQLFVKSHCTLLLNYKVPKPLAAPSSISKEQILTITISPTGSTKSDSKATVEWD